MKNLLFPPIFFAILFSACRQTTAPNQAPAATSENYYTEAHRPQFHFSPEKMWMNDPNGMVYYDGEYHLFYQYYPDANVWGPMHWGHAVSKDLIHWEHLPIALYPDSLGYIFSGSAVVDWNNSSGFGENGKPPLVAIFTHHDPNGESEKRTDFQYQSIAYSNDRGRTWTKYSGNPVLPNTQKIKDFRDPKVIWDKDSKQWVMVFAAGDHIKFFGSQDLKTWTFLSDFGKTWGSHGGVWECPDLFPMVVNTKNETKKWVLLVSINPGGPNGGSATQYFVGQFDGKNFIVDPDFAKDVRSENAVWLDWGRDNYAGVTWSDIPEEDGRRIFMGWMSNWDYAQVVPTEAWRSAMTLPRHLELVYTAKGLRLASKPVEEVESLRSLTFQLDSQMIEGELDLTEKLAFGPSQMEILMYVEFPSGSSADFGIALSNSKGEEYRIGLDIGQHIYYSDRTKAGPTGFSSAFAEKRSIAPWVSPSLLQRFHVFFDVSSCELFAEWGTNTMTEIFFPSEDFDRIKFYSIGGEVHIMEGNIYMLKSVWQ